MAKNTQRRFGDATFCKNIADSYLQTAIYCNELDRTAAHQNILFTSDAYFAIPAITNMAFSCELFLKAIRMLTSPDGAQKGHHLSGLYEDLTAQQKNTLEVIFKKYCPHETVTFESTIKHHCKAFEEWRYVYENGKLQTPDAYIDNLLAAAMTLQEYSHTISKEERGSAIG